MEGFDKAAFDEALNLTSNNLQSVLLLALGYRSHEDKLSSLAKVRKPLSEIIEIVK
jgi:nitroreductase